MVLYRYFKMLETEQVKKLKQIIWFRSQDWLPLNPRMLREADFFLLSMRTFCIWTNDLIVSLIGICGNTLWSCLESLPPSQLYPNRYSLTSSCSLLSVLLCHLSAAGTSQAVAEPEELHQHVVFRASAPMASAQRCVHNRQLVFRKGGKVGEAAEIQLSTGDVSPSLNNSEAGVALYCTASLLLALGARGTLSTDILTVASVMLCGEAKRGITTLMCNDNHTCNNISQEQDNF